MTEKLNNIIYGLELLIGVKKDCKNGTPRNTTKVVCQIGGAVAGSFIGGKYLDKSCKGCGALAGGYAGRYFAGVIADFLMDQCKVGIEQKSSCILCRKSFVVKTYADEGDYQICNNCVRGQ